VAEEEVGEMAPEEVGEMTLGRKSRGVWAKSGGSKASSSVPGGAKCLSTRERRAWREGRGERVPSQPPPPPSFPSAFEEEEEEEEEEEATSASKSLVTASRELSRGMSTKCFESSKSRRRWTARRSGPEHQRSGGGAEGVNEEAGAPSPPPRASSSAFVALARSFSAILFGCLLSSEEGERKPVDI
jgi:hypothetical protein